MGTQNRQRRAAKQRKRQQQTRRVETRSRPSSFDDDPYGLVATFLWSAVKALQEGDTEGSRHIIGLLEEGPPVADGRALVVRVLADLTAQQRVRATSFGWTDDDLVQAERRLLKVPAGATAIERGVHWLRLIGSLGRLPSVEPARPTTPSADDGMLAKIRALLAKAESTTFPEEAEALSAKAQELMARHRIDRVLLEGGNDGPVGRRIWHDNPYADAKGNLLAAVAGANRCRAILLGGLGCSHLVGYATDLDMVELLHTSLLVQATRALAAAGPQTDRRGRSRTCSFRQSFLVAYAWRIGERLNETSIATEVEVDVERGGALLPVLARRDATIDDAMAEAFPRAERMTISASNDAGWVAGAAAAELADLSVGQQLPARDGRLAP